MNKTIVQIMKERLEDMARKLAEVKPFPFMADDENEISESEDN